MSTGDERDWETFGELPEEDRAIVCDDCFNKITEGW